MTIPVIPAPVRLTQGAAGAFTPRAGDRIVAPAAASHVATWFADAVADRLGGPLVVGDDGAEPTAVHLVLDPAAAADAPAATGVHPEGASAVDERYELRVSAEGITVTARAPVGLFRGLTSLRQLIEVDTSLPELEVVDGPRFAWRGLTLDVARTFFGVSEVKAVIDLLATYKLNVLHLHLTDDHGWRIHIDAWPRLTAVGATGAVGDRPGGFYTKDDFREITRYAAERFVTVVPEIDLPGHVSAVFRAHPELARPGTDFCEQPETFGIHLATLDPGQPSTFGFVADVLGEVAELTSGPYLHIGGDEPFGMPDDEYRAFLAGARSIVLGLGKRMVGWQEISRGSVGPGDVLQYWMSLRPGDIELPEGEELGTADVEMAMEVYGKAAGDVGRGLEVGASVLLSPLGVAYLDVGYADDSADPEQEGDRLRVGMPVWPRVTIEAAWDWDPATCVADLPLESIAGVEAALWSETVEDVHDLGFLALPRLPGLAERAWSPNGPRDWQEYRTRLAAHAPSWERAGWNYFRAATVPW